MKRAQWRYARRQLTWMRRMEDVTQIDRGGRDDAEVAAEIVAFLDADGDIACRRMRFEKWQALGNDYVIVEPDDAPLGADARSGSGGSASRTSGSAPTAILLLSAAADERHVAELRIFNPDGSEAELSGNGAREAVLYLRAAGWTDADTFTIITRAGEVTPTITGPDEVSMALGRASVTSPTTRRARGRHRHGRVAPVATGPFGTSTSATPSA